MDIVMDFHAEQMLDSKPRVLVTGSRSWTYSETVFVALCEAHDMLGDFTLISGACPRGADRLAEMVCEHLGMEIELHPADWSLGKRAGFLRNAEMVDMGATLCIAFIRDGSAGATHTARLADRADIPTIRYLA